jgi:Reverse transcriptase (RNA-dependent DNA polymerase).
VLFIDFKKAFDSVKRIKIYEIMQQAAVSKKLVKLIRMAMELSEGRIILENYLSEKSSVFKGVRQSETLSTVLFNITLDHMINKLMSRGTIASKMTKINA